MTNYAGQHSVGESVHLAAVALPLANAAGTRTGDAVNRSAYQSCVLAAILGAETGTPTSFTYDAKIQDSADGSTGWADYTPDGSTVAALTQVTAGSATARLNVDLGGAKKYIRVVEVITITGGSTPKVPAAALLILGGTVTTPVS